MSVTGTRHPRQIRSSVKLFAPVLLASIVLLLTSCQGTQPVVRIGLVAPFEGRHRRVGYDLIYAARLAIRECNAAGCIGGYRVELVALDDGGSPEMAVRAAQTLAIDPLVVAVVGHWREGTTSAAAPIYAGASLSLKSMDESDRWEGEMTAGFRSRYQAVAPFDEEPGPYALPAFEACNRLIEAIGLAVSQGDEPTRETVGVLLSP